jgi:hypothetical protein
LVGRIECSSIYVIGGLHEVSAVYEKNNARRGAPVPAQSSDLSPIFAQPATSAADEAS